MANIKIIDEPMGTGKTCAAINYINSTGEDDHFLVITPYITEVSRYIQECQSKHFVQPYRKGGKKLDGIKDLIRKGRNIVSTHALFQRFDAEVVELCSVLNYTLILDEVAEVVRDTNYSTFDITNLLSIYCDLNEDTGMLTWRDEHKDYKGKFDEAKNMCELGGLALARDKMLMWIFPVEVFKAFQKTFILTYMFDAQLQRYYYDYYGIEYEYMYITGDSLETYRFSDIKDVTTRYDYGKLIHVLDSEKMNRIGNEYFSLSSSWYERNSNSAIMKKLKDNVYNYYMNIIGSKSKYNMWTTFKDYKNQLSGNGYSRGFLFLNARAMNDYRHKNVLAYPINLFLNPLIKGFFQDHSVDVDEDGYALSEMLQWIWRSAIRDGGEIWVYIPSQRMRNLLQEWIKTESK